MSFFDNSGVDMDEPRAPLWAAFATLRDQLERLVLLNLLWAAQLLPAVGAVMFPEWPGWVRLLCVIYSGAALAVATALLYALIYESAQGEPLTIDLVKERWWTHIQPGTRTLASLYGVIGLLLLALIGFDELQVSGTMTDVTFIGAVAVRLLLLLTFTGSLYWGPLWAVNPTGSLVSILRHSVALVQLWPGVTLRLLLLICAVLLIGTVSIGGIFLVVPVVVALIQVHTFLRIR